MSEGRYYNIKEVTLPDSHGSVVELKRGKLESITGKSDISVFGISINPSGRWIDSVSENYSFREITESDAEKQREGEKNWNLQYAWTGSN